MHSSSRPETPSGTPGPRPHDLRLPSPSSHFRTALHSVWPQAPAARATHPGTPRPRALPPGTFRELGPRLPGLLPLGAVRPPPEERHQLGREAQHGPATSVDVLTRASGPLPRTNGLVAPAPAHPLSRPPSRFETSANGLSPPAPAQAPAVSANGVAACATTVSSRWLAVGDG